MKPQAIQYTIRGVPEQLDRALRGKAARENSSLNHLVIEELAHAVLGNSQKADFMDLVGKWVDDQSVDETIESQRVIHPDDWK